MKKLLTFLALFLSLFMTLGAAQAQTRAAITQDRDEQGRNKYFASASCTTVTFQFCSLLFPAVPTGKRLVVTYVSGLNLMPAGLSITSIDLRVQGGTILAWLKPVANPAATSTTNYTVSETLFATFEAGQVPQLLTFVSGNTNFQSVGIISGYTVDLP